MTSRTGYEIEFLVCVAITTAESGGWGFIGGLGYCEIVYQNEIAENEPGVDTGNDDDEGDDDDDKPEPEEKEGPESSDKE